MNYLNAQRKKEAEEMNAAAWERRHHAQRRPTKQERDRVLNSIYGATLDEMGARASERRSEWIGEAHGDPALTLGGSVELQPHEHSFRDREPELELQAGGGSFSSRTYVPRAFYHGGGLLNRPKTREFRLLGDADQRKFVSGLEPRVATASLADLGSVRGRVVQPPFDERNDFEFRKRDPARELHPPMHFKAKTDLERVNSFLGEQPLSGVERVNDGGAFYEAKRMSPYPHSPWRKPEPNKWRAGDFRANTAPAPNRYMFLAGARYDLSLSASERAVTSAAQSRLVTERGPKASSTCEPSPIRHRPRGPRDLELAGDFDLTTRAGGDHGRERANADHRAPFEFHLEGRMTTVAKAPDRRPYHKSLHSPPSTLIQERSTLIGERV